MKTFEIEVRSTFHVRAENFPAAVRELLSRVDFSEALHSPDVAFYHLMGPFVSADPAAWPEPVSEDSLSEQEKAFFAESDRLRAKFFPAGERSR